MRRTWIAAIACAVAPVACEPAGARPDEAPLTAVSPAIASADPTVPDSPAPAPSYAATEPIAVSRADAPPPTATGANELGRIPVIEYHLFGEREGRWERSYDGFRGDLELLYGRGYRPITVSELVDGTIDLPAGLSPVVITFDDASPGQFRYLERDGELVIDPNSALGIWLEFGRRHADWRNKGVFCMLPGAEEGRSFFGDKGIEGQKTEWRLRKVRFLAEQGFELCNHTLWHANLAQYDDARVQEQIGRGALAIDSAVAGYRVRTFALPLGQWPKNRSLEIEGEWTEPRSGRVVRYRHDAVLLVAGGPTRSPHDSLFDPLRITRVQVFADELPAMLDRLDRNGTRYISDGNPAVVAHPRERVAEPPR